MQTRSLQLNMQLDGVLKRKPEKIQAAGIQTLTCAILVQCSNQFFEASELVIKLVHNIPRKDYCDDFLCIYFFILQLKYMKFIYLSFQENNNKYYTRSKNTCVTESTKKTTTQSR